MNFDRVYTILLAAACILFLLLYSILSFYNRLPFEDYIFTSLTKDMGPIGAMMHIYKVYSARWSAHTLAYYFSQFHHFKYFLFCFNLVTLCLLVTSFFLLMKQVLNNYLNLKLKSNTVFIYTVFFTCGFFFCSYSAGETWFWYMVNWMYLWSMIAGNFLFRILTEEKKKAWHFIAILFLTAYIAGAAESYAMICLVGLGLLLVMKQMNLASSVTGRINRPVLVFTLACLFAFYMITLLAPGTWARKDILTHATFFQHIWMCLKAYGIVVLKYTPALVPFLILFGLPWLLLGYSARTEKSIGIKKLLPSFIKSAVWLSLAVFVLVLPASWVLYDVPPARALSQVSLLLYSYSAYVCYYIGRHSMAQSAAIRIVSVGAVSVCIAVILFHIYFQNKTAEKYAAAYDAVINLVQTEKNAGRTSFLEIDPLPPSGMLYSDRLSPDSLGNTYFENVFETGFRVRRK